MLSRGRVEKREVSEQGKREMSEQGEGREEGDV